MSDSEQPVDATPAIDRDNFPIRKRGCPPGCPHCGHDSGNVKETNGQDVVRCNSCGLACYNASRAETGRKPRSVSTTHAAIKPKQRKRILSRASFRCELCGARQSEQIKLHVSHILSVDAGLRFRVSDHEINDDENLMCLCAECNHGFGAEPLPLRLAIVVLRARIAWRDRHEPINDEDETNEES